MSTKAFSFKAAFSRDQPFLAQSLPPQENRSNTSSANAHIAESQSVPLEDPGNLGTTQARPRGFMHSSPASWLGCANSFVHLPNGVEHLLGPVWGQTFEIQERRPSKRLSVLVTATPAAKTCIALGASEFLRQTAVTFSSFLNPFQRDQPGW